MTVRQGEDMDTEKIGEIPLGITVEVTEVGAGRRIKVTCPLMTGWISTRTASGSPLIMKRIANVRVQEDFEVGGKHEVKSHVTVRDGESLESVRLFELRKGEVITILAISQHNRRRAKIKTEAGRQGWISLSTREGELLVGQVTRSKEKGWFAPRADNNKIRTLLEGAMTGDTEAVRSVIESSKPEGMFGRIAKQYDYLNCTDLRGKTALIYAANYGREDVVRYLVSQPGLIVNAVDDTMKTALHHACKYSGESAAPEQDMQHIVKILVEGGADVEARDMHGCTPLMYTSANGDAVVAQILLDAQSNINHTDYEGHGAIQYAIEFGHEDLAKMLYASGAHVSDRDELYIVDPARAASMGSEDDTLIHMIADVPPGGVMPQCDQISERSSSPASKSGKKEAPHSLLSRAPTPQQPAEAVLSVTTPKTSKPGGKKKPKAGAKKKAAGPSPSPAAAPPGGKKPAKKKKMGKAMAAMRADQAAAPKGKGAKKQVIALIENEKEEVAPKELARQKLQAIMDVSPNAVELELAIKDAEGVEGVDPNTLETARQMLERKQREEAASQDLQQAVDVAEVTRLQAAIDDAVAAGVPAALIQSARQRLAEEIPREQARKELKAAQDSGNLDALKKAIKDAERAKMSPEELGPYEKFLQDSTSKDKVEKELAQAIEGRDVTMLKLQIQAAKDVGVSEAQIRRAEQVLKEEEPKVKAREALAAAVDSGKKDKILLAMEAAAAAGVEQSTITWAQHEIQELERKEAQMKEVRRVLDSISGVSMKDLDALTAAKKQLATAIAEARRAGVPETSLAEVELRRRKLHNATEDLKGAIRVFCRVRPLSPKELGQGDTDVTASPNPMKVIVEDKDFVFDAVFKPGTQGEVFEACRDLVQSAIDGYNVTMFAYGQTGAGKTFTMYGTEELPGTAPLTIQELFMITERDAERYTFTVTGSMMELYNSSLVDLLAKEKRGKKEEVEPLTIRTDKDGNVMFEGLLEEQCTTEEAFDGLLKRGNAARTTASTAMNADSSRSHLVIVIKVVTVNKETSKMVKGKILLVDLAGSERLKKSKVTAEGQKEAIEINKSLTALGDVIEGLTKKEKGSVIPYRNHKLTMLMQDALGGTAKTLMFVNCSPAASNAEETLMSLKWAQRAKQIQNNTGGDNASKKESKPPKKKKS